MLECTAPRAPERVCTLTCVALHLGPQVSGPREATQQTVRLGRDGIAWRRSRRQTPVGVGSAAIWERAAVLILPRSAEQEFSLASLRRRLANVYLPCLVCALLPHAACPILPFVPFWHVTPVQRPSLLHACTHRRRLWILFRFLLVTRFYVGTCTFPFFAAWFSFRSPTLPQPPHPDSRGDTLTRFF